MSSEDQLALYELPDLFPFMVDALPSGGGSVVIDDFDLTFYETAYGKVEGTLDEGSYPTNEYALLYYNNYLNQPLGQPCQSLEGQILGFSGLSL